MSLLETPTKPGTLVAVTHRGLLTGHTCCPVSLMFNALRAGMELSLVAVASIVFALMGLTLVSSKNFMTNVKSSCLAAEHSREPVCTGTCV